MTDDEYLALFRAASPKAQRQAIMIGLALLDFIQRKKAAKRQRQQTPATADSVETQTVKPETPAPLVVIPTPVEKKQQITPQYVPGMDLNVFRAQVNAANGVKVAEHDEDILRGKIKSDDDEVF